MRANSVDPDENSLSADSSASTVFPNSAIFVFGALRAPFFNALLQLFSLNISIRETYAHRNKKDAKGPAHYWPVLTL